MENLEHDPRTKLEIRDLLFNFLYDPVHRHFKNRIEDLILRNCLAGGYTHKSFSYRGVLYSCDVHQPPIKKNRLVPQLRPEMEQYLADKSEIDDREAPFVLGYINQVLNSSDSFVDYLKLFPSTLHRPLQELAATCPCKIHKLEQAKIDKLKEKNEDHIRLLKRRMVANLLL